MSADDFKNMAKAVAEMLIGEANQKLSKPTDLRYGTNGSLSLDLEKGTFFDHQEGVGGGVLWFIERQNGKNGKEAIDWLKQEGFHVGETSQSTSNNRSSQSSKTQTEKPAQAKKNDGPPMKPVATWDYTDANGKLIFQVVRMENGEKNSDGKAEKSYRQRKPDASAKGGWNWSTKGVLQVPYQLQELKQAIQEKAIVFVCEGEKAADKLRSIGVPATTNARGALKWPSALNEHFKGARVVIIPDNDPQAVKTERDGSKTPLFNEDGTPLHVGENHAKMVGQNLLEVAKDIRILNLPNLPEKGDAFDWIEAGGNVDQLYKLAKDAPKYKAPPFKSSFHAVTWGNMDADGPEHEWLVKNMITRQELSMLAGPSQSGKSFIAIDLALAIAQGHTWFGRKTKKGGVVYQAGEGAKGIKKRIRAYRQHHEVTTESEIPFVLLPSRVDLYNADDHTNEIIKEIKHWDNHFQDENGVGLELVVIDTWATATPGANENDGKDVSIVLDRCARISRETGAAVLLVHHMNAEGSKVRGHTSIKANLESVIVVKQIEGLRDSSQRQLREFVLDKNKDGEGGQVSRFVLKGIQIGLDEDGDSITSCVIQQPDGAASDADPIEMANVSDKEALVIRAMESAIKENGTSAPAIVNISSSVKVVEWDIVKLHYSRLDFNDVSPNETEGETCYRLKLVRDKSEKAHEWNERLGEAKKEDEMKSKDRRKKALTRARESLTKKGIISGENPFMWFTGRKIKGYRGDGVANASQSYATQEPAPAHMEPKEYGNDEMMF